MKKFCAGAAILMAFGIATVAVASDVGAYYWVLKKKDFDQTSVLAPAPSGAPFQLTSLIEHGAGGTLQGSSSITPPASGIINTPQFYTVAVDGSLQYDAYLGSQSDLDAAFGFGGYHLDVQGDSNSYSVTLSLTGSYPLETPKLSNTNFQNGELVVDATTGFTLTWNSFADAGPLDQIILTVSQAGTSVLRSVLPASATSQGFGANFLKPEQTYLMELNFAKVSQKNTASIAGSTGLAGLATSTHINLSTSTRTPVNGLGNISTRGLIGVGDNVLIPGFIVTSAGNSTLNVVLRALGPSLTAMGVVGALQDPVLYLYNAQGNVLAVNDDWANTPGADEIKAVGLAPTDARESALLEVLVPGQYTALVQGKNTTTGIGLAEIYNLGSDGDAKLANISTRGQVRTADQVMIGGVIIQGGFAHNVILRAIGPSLVSAGIPNPLANPNLQLFDANGTSLQFNDNWRDTQEAQIIATGIPPTNDLESAIVRVLVPGNYTAIVTGKNGNTGVALVEAYTLN